MQALDFSIQELDRKTDHFCDDERQLLNTRFGILYDCSWPTRARRHENITVPLKM